MSTDASGFDSRTTCGVRQVKQAGMGGGQTWQQPAWLTPSAGSNLKEETMAYTDFNFKTKKALKEAVASGQTVTVYQPGPFGGCPTEGTVALEGPHYPAAHSWYAQATLKDGQVVGVK